MKKIILIVMLLVSVCGSCFAEMDYPNWVNCGSEWEFDASEKNIKVGERDDSVGFGDELHFIVPIRKVKSQTITYGLVHFRPLSLNPYLFTFAHMSKYTISTDRMKDINPPNPASFNDPILAKAICNYAGIEMR